MAGTLLAARFVAMWGLGFATGLFAAQLSMAGTGRPEGSGAPAQAQPSASTAHAAVEAAGEPARAPSSSRRGQQPTGAMRFDARYDFDVSIDGTDRATVLERLTATNTTARSINHLDLFVLPNFDAPGFREFELGSVRVDGRVVETLWTRDGANLEVVLPHPLEPGQTARVMILFWLRPATAADGDGDLAAALSRRGALMQFHLWYPMLSDGHGVALDSDGA